MKTYTIELVYRELNTLVSCDIQVTAKTKNKARTLARNYAKQKGYKLITMAFE